MTARKKPRIALASKSVAAPALTANQQRAATLFGAIDDEMQVALLRMLEETARTCPRGARPALRLVVGAR